MRSVWSTLVAVTLVVAGVRVTTAQAGRAGHSELHAAKCLHAAPPVRRAHNQTRPLGSFVAVARVELRAATRQILAAPPTALASQPVTRHALVFSARGPPRA